MTLVPARIADRGSSLATPFGAPAARIPTCSVAPAAAAAPPAGVASTEKCTCCSLPSTSMSRASAARGACGRGAGPPPAGAPTRAPVARGPPPGGAAAARSVAESRVAQVLGSDADDDLAAVVLRHVGATRQAEPL